MFEDFPVESLDALQVLSHENISLRDFSEQASREMMHDFALYSNNKTKQLNHYDIKQLWNNDVFRSGLIATLKPAFSKLYGVSPSSLKDEIFMIEEFSDEYLNDTSELMKNYLLENMAREFAAELEYIESGDSGAPSLRDLDLNIALESCYYSVMQEARQTFQYCTDECKAELQSVFAN